MLSTRVHILTRVLIRSPKNTLLKLISLSPDRISREPPHSPLPRATANITNLDLTVNQTAVGSSLSSPPGHTFSPYVVDVLTAADTALNKSSKGGRAGDLRQRWSKYEVYRHQFSMPTTLNCAYRLVHRINHKQYQTANRCEPAFCCCDQLFSQGFDANLL